MISKQNSSSQKTIVKPRLAITLGDPAGVGPEVSLKALQLVEMDFEPVLIGSLSALRDAAKRFQIGVKIRAWGGEQIPDSIPAVDVLALESPIEFGAIRREYGEIAWKSIKVAVDMVTHGLVDGIVTAPICKQSLQLAGCRHAGHTELLAELSHVQRTVMMLANSRLKVVLVTTHIPLKDVAPCITKDRVLETIEITTHTFEKFGWGKPRLGVLGLNPHAGEQGAIGTEDNFEIIPAVEEARRNGSVCHGPIPADTAFHRALSGEFDVLVAMYHDQGLGPLKTLSFADVINITLGLPFIRVSPGHGTAFDIAGTGRADPTSMTKALEAAISLCSNASSE